MWAARGGIGLVLVLTALWRPTAATAEEICASGGSAQFFNEIRYCVSSVRAPEGETAFGPDNLMKGDPAKAWCGSAADHGAGGTITIHIEGGPAFRRLLVSNGYGRSAETYTRNARVRIVEITGDGGLDARVIFPDRKDMVPIDLPTMARNWISLKIVDVYPGQQFPNACLTYLTPDLEYEEELLLRKQGVIK
jgi:hypothetical protein